MRKLSHWRRLCVSLNAEGYRTKLDWTAKYSSYRGARECGYYTDDGKLIYAGRVGTGMPVKVLADLRRRLDRFSRPNSPRDVPLPRKTRLGLALVLSRLHWVEPQLVAEISSLALDWRRIAYLRNAFRIIADVARAPTPLLPAVGGVVQPLDLTMATTRAVSPVHIEYLRNMGVGASLSISIIVNGKLWGLIACHNETPRLPSFVMRTAAELFGQMYALTLESRLHQAASEEAERVGLLSDRLLSSIASDPSLLKNAQWLQDVSRDMIVSDGVAIYHNGEIFTSGAAPPDNDVRALAQELALASPSRVFDTDCLASVHSDSAASADRAAGMLAIPLSRISRDYIMLFRREWIQEIKWGGDPAKAVEQRNDGVRLSPRKSFAAFASMTRGRSRPFTPQDRRTASRSCL
jgi:light-regulated signal transduction histidine kinase (bacteriophytochrome)